MYHRLAVGTVEGTGRSSLVAEHHAPPAAMDVGACNRASASAWTSLENTPDIREPRVANLHGAQPSLGNTSMLADREPVVHLAQGEGGTNDVGLSRQENW